MLEVSPAAIIITVLLVVLIVVLIGLGRDALRVLRKQKKQDGEGRE